MGAAPNAGIPRNGDGTHFQRATAWSGEMGRGTQNGTVPVVGGAV
jgi:hypothetical protein